MIEVVGLQCDYSTAVDNAAAAATIGWPGGPSRPLQDASGFTTLPLPGIEPVVMMGLLDAILNDRSFDEVLTDPSGYEVATADGVWVWALTHSLQDALARRNEVNRRAGTAKT